MCLCMAKASAVSLNRTRKHAMPTRHKTRGVPAIQKISRIAFHLFHNKSVVESPAWFGPVQPSICSHSRAPRLCAILHTVSVLSIYWNSEQGPQSAVTCSCHTGVQSRSSCCFIGRCCECALRACTTRSRCILWLAPAGRMSSPAALAATKPASSHCAKRQSSAWRTLERAQGRASAPSLCSVHGRICCFVLVAWFCSPAVWRQSTQRASIEA